MKKNETIKRAVLERKDRAEQKRKDEEKQERENRTQKEQENQTRLLEAIKKKEYPKEIKVLDGVIEIKKGIEITNLKSLDGLKVEITNPVSKLEITNPVKEISIKDEVEIAQPKWWKDFDEMSLTRKMVKGLVEVYKAVVIKVSADRHTIPKNALAVKMVDSKGRYVNLEKQLMQISRGGASTGGGTEGGATEATLQLVLTELQSINTKINIYIDNETPNGNIDGVNKTFTTHYNYKPNTPRVFLNGIRQAEGLLQDYIENGNNEIVFNDAPVNDDIILVDYIKN